MMFDVHALRAREFPWAEAGKAIYLNNASTGPLPQRSVLAADEFNAIRGEPFRLSDTLQFRTLDRSRELLANLIGAHPSEIALATNTSFGINLAAFGLPFARGDVILSAQREFPANVYPWMQLAARRGIEFRQLECADGVLEPELVRRALESDRVRALTVSWVSFLTGARVDLAALGALCRERGIYFIVDAIQGLGAATMDVSSFHVDIVACGAQKWLLSPWGTGFVYVRRDVIPELEPHDVSWLAVKGSDDFNRLLDYDLTWRDDARRFEFITLPFQDFAGMNESLELIHDIGAHDAAAHVAHLADVIVDWAAAKRGVTLLTPTDLSRRAGIVSVRPPGDPSAVSARLGAAGVSHSLREGAIRLSPHFYNTEAEVRRACELMVSS